MATVTSSKTLPCSWDKLLMVLLIVCDTPGRGANKGSLVAEEEEYGTCELVR